MKKITVKCSRNLTTSSVKIYIVTILLRIMQNEHVVRLSETKTDHFKL